MNLGELAVWLFGFGTGGMAATAFWMWWTTWRNIDA